MEDPNDRSTGFATCIRYLVLLRFPVLLGLSLVCFPFLARTECLAPALRNLFVVTPYGLACITTLGILLSWVLMLYARVIYQEAPHRYRVRPEDLPRVVRRVLRRVERRRRWIAPLLCAPLIAVALRESAASEWPGPSLLQALAEPGDTLDAFSRPLVAAWAGLLVAVIAGVLTACAIRWLLTFAFTRGGRDAEPGAAIELFPNYYGAHGSRKKAAKATAALSRSAREAVQATAQKVLSEDRRNALKTGGQRLWAPISETGSRVLAHLPKLEEEPGEGTARAEPRLGLKDQLVLLALFLGVLALYGWFGQRHSPTAAGAGSFPALGYLLLLWMVAAWLLPAASYYLDRVRVSTLILLIAVSLVGYQTCTVDHYYELKQPTAESATSDPLGAEAVVEAWLGPQSPEAVPPMIAVATSGGGITASAWTVEVLSGLEDRVGARFTRSLVLLTGVSGGSVGTMFYLDGFSRDCGAVSDAPKKAATSSLSQTGWGLAYLDVWRFLFAPLVAPYPKRDRGWALEQAWKKNLSAATRDKRLEDWRAPIRQGRLPVPIFGATIVQTGEILFLSPVDLAEPARSEAPSVATADEPGASHEPFRTFRRLYRDYDVDITTAVRLSATFPFVTPIARPWPRSIAPAYHLADGGYYDNFGIEALITWLDEAIPAFHERGGRDVVIVQIRAFEPNESEEKRLKDLKKERGWVHATLGPLNTILNVRTVSQIVRNDQELALKMKEWQRDFADLKIHDVGFALGFEDAPLSWKLSKAEHRRIVDRWKDARYLPEIEKVGKTLYGSAWTADDRPERDPSCAPHARTRRSP